jgi:hypothetical protein
MEQEKSMKTFPSRLLGLMLLSMLAACNGASSDSTSSAGASATTPSAESSASTGERPMDEVPVQTRLPNGDRQYGFRNGCTVVLEARRSVVKTEAAVCELHHRDIALLYASGD